MICRPRQHGSSDDHLAIFRLSGNALDQKTLELFLHDHLWTVEEELRMYLGRPPWFDFALCFAVGEIVRDFQRYKAARNGVGLWIRQRARQAAETLEPTLARRHTENGFVKFNGCETLEALVGSVLQTERSLYWEEFRLPTPLFPRRGPLGGSY
jgi:hypothetical protein